MLAGGTATLSTPRILVTGAAGKTGLAVIGRLLEIEPGGPIVRALARNAGQKHSLEEAGVHETAVGDLGDATGVAEALQSVDIVYHICPNVHPEEVAIGRQIIALAAAAGAGRFLFHSVLQPEIRAMPHHWAKHLVEQFLVESNLDVTILQPAPYMQNILGQRREIAEKGLYRVPYAVATRVSMVDLEDVAEAVARIVSETAHSGATYELCAPELLDQTAIAAALGRALGRRVRAESVDRRDWAGQMRGAGMSADRIETLRAMFRYYERLGMSGSEKPLERLLGRPPTQLAAFLARTLGSRI